MIEITSRDNPKLKQIRKIRDRQDDDFIFIEGLRLAREALRSPGSISTAVFAKSFSDTEEFSRVPEQIIVPDRIFDSLGDTKSSQGVILIAPRPATDRISFEDRFTGKTAVCLHRVGNPSNLGAILRTCEASGVTDIVITKNSSDVFAPKSIRASMGSVFRLNFWTGADFGEVVDLARIRAMRSTAADISGQKSYRETDWSIPRLIVFGSEADGLSADELNELDETIVIPMKNGVESLNLAVSAGIILFEAAAG